MKIYIHTYIHTYIHRSCNSGMLLNELEALRDEANRDKSKLNELHVVAQAEKAEVEVSLYTYIHTYIHELHVVAQAEKAEVEVSLHTCMHTYIHELQIVAQTEKAEFQGQFTYIHTYIHTYMSL
jgi:hypothetical protein